MHIVIDNIKSSVELNHFIRELRLLMEKNKILKNIGVRYKKNGSVSTPLSEYIDMSKHTLEEVIKSENKEVSYFDIFGGVDPSTNLDDLNLKKGKRKKLEKALIRNQKNKETNGQGMLKAIANLGRHWRDKISNTGHWRNKK